MDPNLASWRSNGTSIEQQEADAGQGAKAAYATLASHLKAHEPAGNLQPLFQDAGPLQVADVSLDRGCADLCTSANAPAPKTPDTADHLDHFPFHQRSIEALAASISTRHSHTQGHASAHVATPGLRLSDAGPRPRMRARALLLTRTTIGPGPRRMPHVRRSGASTTTSRHRSADEYSRAS